MCFVPVSVCGMGRVCVFGVCVLVLRVSERGMVFGVVSLCLPERIFPLVVLCIANTDTENRARVCPPCRTPPPPRSRTCIHLITRKQVRLHMNKALRMVKLQADPSATGASSITATP